MAVTLFSILNFSIKYWPKHNNFACNKIVFDDGRYVWYAHFFKIEIAYEQFRN